MAAKGAARAVADQLHAALLAEGALPVEAPILLPADTLLDLYGEDIRARAYVTADPLRGEMMLRPDFTVPVVQVHMSEGAEPARYAYKGEVFRKQERPSARAVEYLQVGYEVFDRDDPIGADAEVFALFARLLAPLSLRPVTGDIAILRAAVEGLRTTGARKAALLRHIWRPMRFRRLLDRFGRARDPRVALADEAPLIGLRSPAEIDRRLVALAEDCAAPPISEEERALLDTILDLSAPAGQALAHLGDLARVLPAIGPAVTRMGARLAALDQRGVAAASLPFEASHGRTTLEYYDGFVFSFHAADPSLPPVASGGRYDALTAHLGQGEGQSIPAVGGIFRPGLVADLGGL